MVTSYAQTWRPAYLFLGNETNVYFASHTQPEWDAWVSEYAASYDAIKAVSPGTRVFTTFQLEHTSALGGATTGWTDPPSWSAVDSIVATGKLDLLGITTYPYFEHATPAAIPADYSDELAQHWSGALALTETGWLGGPHFPYPGGEADQADFAARVFELTQEFDLEYVIWLFRHDWDGQALTPAVADIGLRSNDGALIRAADAVWRAQAALRE